MTATLLPSENALRDFRIEEVQTRRKRTVVAVVYCTYGDESRDESSRRVYAVAGAFGLQQHWDALESLWNARLDGKIFHAADCESDMGDFSGIPHEENLSLYRDLITLVAESKIIGHGIAVNVDDYRQHFPSDPEHAPYIWGFGDIVQVSSQLAYLSVPPGEVKVVFDRNEELQFSATEMYRYLIHSRLLPTKNNLFGEIAFACRRTVGIQVADLLARETMKSLDNQIGPTWRPRRLSYLALKENEKLRVVVYDKRHFDDVKRAFRSNSYPKRREMAT